MKPYAQMSREELMAEKAALEAQFAEIKAKKLKRYVERQAFP